MTNWRRPAAIFAVLTLAVILASVLGLKVGRGGGGAGPCTISGRVVNDDGTPAAGDMVGYRLSNTFLPLATVDPKGGFKASCDEVTVETPKWGIVVQARYGRETCLWSHPNTTFSKTGDHKGVTLHLDQAGLVCN